MTQQILILIGHLGGDPEMRFTADGTAVTNFSLATNRTWKNSEGEKQEQTTWFRVSCWRGLAETVNQYLSKGRQVYVEGHLNPNETGNPRAWVGNDGEPRARYEMTATTVRFLGKGDGVSAPPESIVDQSGPKEDDSEIPF